MKELYYNFCDLTGWCSPEVVSIGGILLFLSSAIILLGFIFGFFWGFFDNRLDGED
jgi:hypothetical protein